MAKGNGGLWPAWIAAVAAVCAALLGGGASVYAAKETLDTQGTQEQSKWQRDAQQAAYKEFYGAVQAEYELSMECVEFPNNAQSGQQSKASDALLGLELFGSQETVTLARETVEDVRKLRAACGKSQDAVVSARRAAEAMRDILEPGSNSLQSLVNSMRRDLGIEEYKTCIDWEARGDDCAVFRVD